MDPRLSDIIQSVPATEQLPLTADDRKPKVLILGFPHDEGVRRNGGRVGSAQAPSAFRKWAYRLCASDSMRGIEFAKHLTLVDWGDVDAGCLPIEKTPNAVQLEDYHEELTKHVLSGLKSGYVPWIVGGGNDQSYPNAAGLLAHLCTNKLEAKRHVRVINIDAHLDVRPLKNNQVHSGSPFRLLLEDARFNSQLNGSFIEFAAQPAQCAIEHVRYVQAYPRGRVMFLPQIQHDIVGEFKQLLSGNQADSPTDIFVSFDIDAIRFADCQGVSCASPEGLSASDAIQICYEAGKCERVRLMDLSEYNPLQEEYRTARLLGMMFHAFLCGLVDRNATTKQ